MTGHLRATIGGEAAEFVWSGNDEMEAASGDGWAELRSDSMLAGAVCFDRGDLANFIATG